MKRSSLAPHRAAVLILVAAMGSGGIAPATARAVSSADEICSPTEDPCIITTAIAVDNQSFLDFGSRTVRLTDRGELVTGAGTVTVLCGRFEAVDLAGAEPVAIRARGPSLFGSGIDGGTFEIRAQRQCTENSDQFCLNDRGCDLGTCSANVCSGDPDRVCTSNANCEVGPCIFNQATRTSRCGSTNLRCTTNDDCNFGTCDLATTFCTDDNTRVCNEDADCDDGQCLVGFGDVDIDGRVRADGQAPGSITVIAAGDIRLRQNVVLNAGSADEDGGVLQIVSRLGDVVIDGKLDAQGGGGSQGGDFSMSAGRDLFINNDVNIDGGEFDGGFFDVDAGRDITILGSILASSINRDGFGGEIAIVAGRDVNVPGPANWRTNGHEGSESFCGEAGAQEIDAGRNLNIGPSVVLQANGPEPDCGGEEILLTAGNDAFIAGRLEARAQGAQGAGGAVELAADHSATFTSTAVMDVRGGGDGGGGIDLSAENDLFFDGAIDAVASGGGSGDSVALLSGCLLSVGGGIEIGGTVEQGTNGTVDLDGGDVVVRTGASIINSGGTSRNFIRAAEFVTIEAGALFAADATSGSNEIRYRNPSAAPVIAGVVTPSPALILDTTIPRATCICGNGVLETGESCDDGNHNDGDGCSSACQFEACVAATPTYPAVPLCDDNNECTVDSCDPSTGRCQNVLNCDDGIACTQDTCVGSTCLHAPDDGLCNDGNVCTENICTASAGCIVTFNTDPCNDGIGCTEDDVCDRGDCIGVSDCPAGEICDLSLGTCVATVACGNGAVEPPEQCDDGDSLWQTGQFCSASCTMLACGDPNDSGGVTATDALFVLSTAVSLASCDLCVCNVDDNGGVTATDALRTLQAAVGANVSLTCSVCT